MIKIKERKEIGILLMWRSCIRRKLLRSMRQEAVGCWHTGRDTGRDRKFTKQALNNILRFLMEMILSWRCCDFLPFVDIKLMIFNDS